MGRVTYRYSGCLAGGVAPASPWVHREFAHAAGTPLSGAASAVQLPLHKPGGWTVHALHALWRPDANVPHFLNAAAEHSGLAAPQSHFISSAPHSPSRWNANASGYRCSPAEGSQPPVAESLTVADWTALAKRGDSAAFVQAVADFHEHARLEVLRQLDTGVSAVDILGWATGILLPEIKVIQKARSILGPYHAERSDIDYHDTIHRLTDFAVVVHDYAALECLVVMRSFLAPPDRSFEAIGQMMHTAFSKAAPLGFGGLWDYVALAPTTAPQRLVSVLENLIRNAVEHPREGSTPIHVNVWLIGNEIRVRDNGAGMDAATLAHLHNGVAIHDGVPVQDGPRGFGWISIRSKCEKLGITWKIDSAPGEGTTVILTLPPNFLEPTELLAHRRILPNSDPERLVDLVRSFTPDGKVAVAGMLFDTTDQIRRKAVRGLEAYIKGADELEMVRSQLREDMEHHRQIFETLITGLPLEHRTIVQRFYLWTSESLSWTEKMLTHARCVKTERLTKDGLLRQFLREETDPRKELASGLMEALASATSFPPFVREPATGQMIMEFQRTSSIARFLSFPLCVTWPPDPDDLSLKTVLKVLGWTMQVETHDDTVIVRLDFGKTRI